MTLNFVLTSRTSVYLSGDFRLTYPGGHTKDDPDIQKLILIFTYEWSALVSFAGVAQTSKGLDVGDWVWQQLDSIAMEARFAELPRKLLTADNWLEQSNGLPSLGIFDRGLDRQTTRCDGYLELLRSQWAPLRSLAPLPKEVREQAKAA